MDIITRDYYRKVNRADLVNKGLAAAVASLNDPYSHYLDPSDYHHFQTQSNPHVPASASMCSRSRAACGWWPCSRAHRRRGRACGPAT